MGRGSLTDEVKERSKALLGYEIDLTELRLMPYIQFTMMNDQRLDPRKINSSEREVLKRWKEEGHIEGGASGLSITREFWNIINDLLFMSYVAR